jgi:GT2 family glycosyltransferase
MNNNERYKKMKNLSPIVLFVYNRPWHTQQTIEALEKNELASQSNLIIYSDEAKTKNEQENVDKVRLYISQINKFQKVTIIKREKNWGLANNIIDGITEVVNQHGKIIVLEDDLVTSSHFLKYMNEALDFYKDEEQVMSVSGFSYLKKIPKNYNKDVFIFYRPCSWGWAIWKNEWKLIDFNITQSHEIFSNISLQNNFNRGGNDLWMV